MGFGDGLSQGLDLFGPEHQLAVVVLDVEELEAHVLGSQVAGLFVVRQCFGGIQGAEHVDHLLSRDLAAPLLLNLRRSK